MDTDQLVWIVVAVVVVLAIAALALMLMRRAQHTKNLQRAERASELRTEADQRAEVLPDAQLRAQEERLQAERLRLEAERAQARAQEAETGYLQEAATHEDRLREADRIDPDVSSDTDPGTDTDSNRT